MSQRYEDILDFLDGEMDQARQAELSDWLDQSPEHWELFARVSFIHAAIGDQLRSERSSDHVRIEALSGLGDSDTFESLADLARVEQTAQLVSFQPGSAGLGGEDAGSLSADDLKAVGGYLLRHGLQNRRLMIALASAAAAVALLMTLLVLTWAGGSPSEQVAERPDEAPATPQPAEVPAVVATLIAQHDAQWEPDFDFDTPEPGEALVAGRRLTLSQGMAEITTKRGARVLLEAPVTIGFPDRDNAVYLYSGRLVGVCRTQGSKGFVVSTKHAEIVDLGTEFGVEVTAGGVVASVFSGEIKITPLGGVSEPLVANQTARLRVQGNTRELAVDDRIDQGFVRLLPRPAVITSATINDERFAAEVIPQGVIEDARAFTDREHELNGLDETGIPGELLGGDLVRIPADARPKFSEGTEDLHVELEFARPAQLYLLFTDLDAERGIPAWVTRDYELTPLRLGLDRGSLPFNQIKHVGQGPGVSIDQELQVWKRKDILSGRAVVAGYMQDYFTYTLVAVPKPHID